jgi:hypothetical protein
VAHALEPVPKCTLVGGGVGRHGCGHSAMNGMMTTARGSSSKPTCSKMRWVAAQRYSVWTQRLGSRTAQLQAGQLLNKVVAVG